MEKAMMDKEAYGLAGQVRQVLVAVDGTENAQRAVLYVADILGGMPGFRVTLLHVVQEPPLEYFSNAQQRRDWLGEKEAEGRKGLERYRRILLHSGFEEDQVGTTLVVKACDSLARCIYEEVRRLNACTVVVGRRGISKKEEFLFGSTSNTMVHTARNCAVWVVE
ncbi:MAG: universal stress protein [Nitrospirota bacterium]|jgi:nucleotide-binding universal stress UspA family protein